MRGKEHGVDSGVCGAISKPLPEVGGTFSISIFETYDVGAGVAGTGLLGVGVTGVGTLSFSVLGVYAPVAGGYVAGAEVVAAGVGIGVWSVFLSISMLPPFVGVGGAAPGFGVSAGSAAVVGDGVDVGYL